METIDLRSDTVSLPTPKMREAMANARVGDDVYGDDPTVKELEAESAALLGKEAGLFVTSGTMGNIASIMAHCGCKSIRMPGGRLPLTVGSPNRNSVIIWTSSCIWPMWGR